LVSGWPVLTHWSAATIYALSSTFDAT